MSDTRRTPTLGLIGLGAMGWPMTTNLLQASYPLTVYDVDEQKTARCMAAGAAGGRAVAEVVRGSEVVLTSLPSSEVFVQVAEAEILPYVRAGQIIIDLGTTTPPETRRLAMELASRGAALLDAPVSGGPGGVEKRMLRMFVGGDSEVAARCRPILETVGGPDYITYCGGSGAGQVVKGVNQLAMGLGAAAYLEAVAFGVRAGVDASTIGAAVGDECGGESWRREVARVARQVAAGEGERLGVKFRELPYYLREAVEQGFELPLTGALHALCDAGERVSVDDNRPAPSYWHELMTSRRDVAPQIEGEDRVGS